MTVDALTHALHLGVSIALDSSKRLVHSVLALSRVLDVRRQDHCLPAMTCATGSPLIWGRPGSIWRGVDRDVPSRIYGEQSIIVELPIGNPACSSTATFEHHKERHDTISPAARHHPLTRAALSTGEGSPSPVFYSEGTMRLSPLSHQQTTDQ
jgi:hypothetical protein